MSYLNGFFVFEGIDGVGKSSVASLVQEELNSRYQTDVFYWDKKDTSYKDNFATEQMTTIKQALWDYRKNADISVMGDTHWLFLLASWFHAIDDILIRPAMRAKRSILMDSWHYKFSARYRLKKHFPPSLIDSAFGSLSIPNLVILLTVDSSYAADRKTGIFTPSECGVHDQPQLVGRDRFIAYQEKVQRQLISELPENATVHLDTTGLTLNEVVDKAVEILSYRRTND
ncbi:hypothetical protein [Herbaspirillum sp. RV1423]|uniref:dTMP kinase n=1 Tax=Herbaspirillum sp. RV1423 TaxID=1443993 RepID=UPI00054F242D|nr:hypothetical protein [Herbaspirillum sp. RV1423]